MIAVRDATEADDEAVGALLVDAFETQHRRFGLEPSTPERLADLRNQAEKRRNASVLVAEQGGRLAGTVSVYKPGAPRNRAWISGAADLRLLAVAPAFQGGGVASLLMAEAEARARGWSADLCLHTRREAGGLHRFYERRGYRRDETGDLALPDVFLHAYRLALA